MLLHIGAYAPDSIFFASFPTPTGWQHQPYWTLEQEVRWIGVQVVGWHSISVGGLLFSDNRLRLFRQSLALALDSYLFGQIA